VQREIRMRTDEQRAQPSFPSTRQPTTARFSTASVHFALLAGSLIIAGALLSLASSFRHDGILGALQEALSVLFVAPYVLGIVFGGNPHSPSTVGVFLGLFAEIYVLGLLIWWTVRRWR
jgi:hypothetical protein